MKNAKRIARISAFIGWLFTLGLVLYWPASGDLLGAAPETQLIHLILFLAVFVTTPLGLSLVSEGETNSPVFLRIAIIMQPLGALAVFLSFLLPVGAGRAACCLLWLLTTSFGALEGLSRLARREFAAGELAITAGLLYLPVGAVWLLMSQLDLQLLGFGATIVLLTAVHFHFAGFAAPMLVGLAGRNLPDQSTVRTLIGITAFAVVMGTPLVAAGITFSPLLAFLGAIVVSIGLFLLAIIVIKWVVPKIPAVNSKLLLIISSVAALPAMTLAIVYAYSIVSHKLFVDIPTMALTHGVMNAVGFSLCGLFAWTLIDVSRVRSQRRMKNRSA